MSHVPTLKRKRTAKEEAVSNRGASSSSPHREAMHKSEPFAKETPLSSDYFIEDDSADERDHSSRFETETGQTSPLHRESTEAMMMRDRALPARLDNRRFIGRNGSLHTDAMKDDFETNSSSYSQLFAPESRIPVHISSTQSRRICTRFSRTPEAFSLV
jgi:hypothetical protein